MNRYQFQVARWRADEETLSQLSHPLQPELDGAQVALVGNARALGNTGSGPRIDAAQIVIRLNDAPIPDPASHGRKTDWIAMSTPVSEKVLKTRAARRLMWMTPKRRRLKWRIANTPGFYLHPETESATLQEALAARPTTGLMTIDILARSNCAKIDLYGFDFFESLSLSGHRTVAHVPHNFAAERDWVRKLMQRDTRVTLHPMT